MMPKELPLSVDKSIEGTTEEEDVKEAILQPPIGDTMVIEEPINTVPLAMKQVDTLVPSEVSTVQPTTLVTKVQPVDTTAITIPITNETEMNQIEPSTMAGETVLPTSSMESQSVATEDTSVVPMETTPTMSKPVETTETTQVNALNPGDTSQPTVVNTTTPAAVQPAPFLATNAASKTVQQPITQHASKPPNTIVIQETFPQHRQQHIMYAAGKPVVVYQPVQYYQRPQQIYFDYEPEIVPFVPKQPADEKTQTRKAQKYFIVGVVFFGLAFLFFWTYLLPWIFLFVSSVYFSLCASKYGESPYSKPRSYARIAAVLNAFIFALFCTLFCVGFVVLLGSILGGTARV